PLRRLPPQGRATRCARPREDDRGRRTQSAQMINALIIVFREGFEAFLTVAIIFAYLRKTGRDWLRSAVYAGIVVSVFASFGLGWTLQTSVHQPVWEGVLGLVAAVLVATFVIHVWRTAPR